MEIVIEKKQILSKKSNKAIMQWSHLDNSFSQNLYSSSQFGCVTTDIVIINMHKHTFKLETDTKQNNFYYMMMCEILYSYCITHCINITLHCITTAHRLTLYCYNWKYMLKTFQNILLLCASKIYLVILQCEKYYTLTTLHTALHYATTLHYRNSKYILKIFKNILLLFE